LLILAAPLEITEEPAGYVVLPLLTIVGIDTLEVITRLFIGLGLIGYATVP